MLVLRCVPGGRTAFHRHWRQRSLAGILLLLHITYFMFGILPGLRMGCRCYYNNKNNNNSNDNDDDNYYFISKYQQK